MTKQQYFLGELGKLGDLVVDPDRNSPNGGRIGILVEIKDAGPNPYVIEYQTGGQWAVPFAAKVTDDFMWDYTLSSQSHVRQLYNSFKEVEMNRDEVNKDIAAQLRAAANWPGHDRDGLLAKADQVQGFTRPLYRNYSAIEADLPALLEIARVALQDGDLFDMMGDNLDLCDEEMIRLRDNLESFMQADIPAGSTGSPLARALACLPEYNPHMDDNMGTNDGSMAYKEDCAAAARAIARHLAYANGVIDFDSAGKAAEEAFYQD